MTHNKIVNFLESLTEKPVEFKKINLASCYGYRNFFQITIRDCRCGCGSKIHWWSIAYHDKHGWEITAN
jgi:hypothetical protein